MYETGDVSVKQPVFFPRVTVCTTKVRVGSTTGNKIVKKQRFRFRDFI